MDESQAQTFAQSWIAVWNSQDLAAILSHYSDDVVLTSPLVARVLGAGHATLSGKVALAQYWGSALKKYPDLHFTLFRAYPGVNSIVLHYRSVAGLVGAEFMRFDANGKICEVQAHYALEQQ
jgi:SnoaL-like domain